MTNKEHKSGYDKVHVVLINLPNPNSCPWLDSFATIDQLGLAYLCAYLRERGYSVKIIDSATLNLSIDSLLNHIMDLRPKLIGIGPDFTTIVSALKISKQIKNILPYVRIVFGGHHSSFSAKEILSGYKEVDFIIRGEGEISLLSLLVALENQNNLSSVPGLVYRCKDESIKFNTPPDAIEELDSLPFPGRDVLSQAIAIGRPRTTGIITSRGCVMNCNFCSTPPFVRLSAGSKWRCRSAENVVDEIEMLVKDLDVKLIFFRDDDFLGCNQKGLDRAIQIAEQILSRHIKVNFRILTRANSICIGGDSLLRLLKSAGLIRVFLGVEASSTNSLKFYGKTVQLPLSISAIQLLQKHNIAVQIGFITFNPYTTFDDIESSANFLEISGMGAFFKNVSDRVELYPGARIVEMLSSAGLLNGYDPCSGVPYAYRFQNPDIHRLAVILSSLRDQFCELDKYVLDLDLWAASKKASPPSIRKNVVDTHISFFRNFINLVREKADARLVEEIKGDYIAAVEVLKREIQKRNPFY